MRRSSFRGNNYLFAPFIAGSGMFTGNYDATSFYQDSASSEASHPENYSTFLYNVKQTAVQQVIKETAPVEQQHKFIKNFHEPKNSNAFNSSAFDSYDHGHFEKPVLQLLRCDHEVLFFSLRGCSQPEFLYKIPMIGLKTLRFHGPNLNAVESLLIEDSYQLIWSLAIFDTMTGLKVDAVNCLMLNSPQNACSIVVRKSNVSNGNGEGDN